MVALGAIGIVVCTLAAGAVWAAAFAAAWAVNVAMGWRDRLKADADIKWERQW